LLGARLLQLLSADVYLRLGSDQLASPISAARDDFVVQLFNTPLLGDQGELYRLNGPNLHPISLGYALATFALICLSGRKYGETLSYLVPLVFSGAKGALIYFIFTTLGIAIVRKCKTSLVFLGVLALMLVYIVVTFVIGRDNGDYHVLGLIGSIKAFVEHPLGSGLGAGGNLSTVLTFADWQRAQHLGYTEVPVESALGVALYQMGFAASALVAFYLWLAWVFWKGYLASDNQLLLF